jgi:hypothetical protein
VKNLTEQFCQDLLDLFPKEGKALVNLLLSLSSFTVANSVTGLSESRFYHYQYSSICDVIHNLALSVADYEKGLSSLVLLLEKYYDLLSVKNDYCGDFAVLQIDVCNAEKGSTACFENRSLHYKANNQVTGNKPVSPGYAVSFVNVCCGLTGWSLPLLRHRVEIDETDTNRAHKQLTLLLKTLDLSLFKDFCVAVLDSKYGNAAYLSPVYAHTNLVNVVRHQFGTKVYLSPVAAKEGKKGAPTQYGEQYVLIPENRLFKSKNKHGEHIKEQKSIFNVPHDSFFTKNETTTKGRELKIDVYQWNNLKITSKKGNNMKDKPFDLCCVRVFDAKTSDKLFKHELWFTVNGQKKETLSTQQAYESYRKRYGIEPFFRFNKQNLFFQDYQTPVVQHFDNWGLISQMAVWMLFISQGDIQNKPKKWQKYLEKNKEIDLNTSTKLTMTQAYHSAEYFFDTLEQKDFLPKAANKPHGRLKGDIQDKRKKYPIVKKSKIKPKNAPKSEEMKV